MSSNENLFKKGHRKQLLVGVWGAAKIFKVWGKGT